MSIFQPIYVCQQNRTTDLSKRMYDRNIPSHQLAPSYFARPVDTYATKLQFLGTLVGDYTRIAIGTAINTGTYIGFGSNIFNHDITKKYISSFSWGNNERVNLNQFLETVSKMKIRRNKNISDEAQQFSSDLYNNFIKKYLFLLLI